MPCVVPTCGASVGTFKLFPRHITLVERWLEAILVGCGVKADEGDGDLSRMEVCHWHFAKPDAKLYQEPKIFFNCKTEKVEIDSCRLCLRFHPISEMVSRDGMLSGKDINNIVYESLCIDFQPNDLLELICVDCLARLELLKSIQEEFIDAEIQFQNFRSIFEDKAKEIRRPVEQPLQVKVIMKDQEADSNTESDVALDDEYFSDEWTPPKAIADILINQSGDGRRRKSKPNSCDDSKQSKISLKKIVARKCYICPVILESKSELSSHLTEKHSDMKANRCEECSQDFPMLYAYNKHLAHHDETERPNKCSFCPMRFSTPQAMKKHENTYHGMNHHIVRFKEKIKPAICETCGESFEYKSLLTRHVRDKHDSSREKPNCKICSKTFTTHGSLVRHMLVHTNDNPYQCKICDASFRRLLNLRHHVQKVHEGKNPHVCAECNLACKSYVSLYNHKRVVHQKRLPRKPNSIAMKPSKTQYTVICLVCNEIFPRSADLKQHIATAHADESYPYIECPECPRTFPSEQQLVTHRRQHSTEIFPCGQCEKQYRSTQALKLHMESIHEKQQFNCTMCSKTYKTRSSLQMHMTFHTKGKRWECDFCDKTFHRKDQLTVHRRIHTGEKPFECPNCLRRFGDGATFCKHKKLCLARSFKKEESVDVDAS